MVIIIIIRGAASNFLLLLKFIEQYKQQRRVVFKPVDIVSQRRVCICSMLYMKQGGKTPTGWRALREDW